MSTVMTKPAIDNEKLDVASDILRAIAHPVRLSIMAFVHKNKKVNVNKIYNNLKLEQSITSQHLKILRNADLVETTRDGKFIIYNLNYDKIGHVMKYINAFFVKK